MRPNRIVSRLQPALPGWFFIHCVIIGLVAFRTELSASFMAVAGIMVASYIFLVPFQSHTENRMLTTHETRVQRLCLWLPSDYREAILGDLLEDCDEYASRGATKKQIDQRISWEILLAVVRSWPAALAAAVKQVFSTK